MPPAGFETTIPASERPQTHALESGAIGIGPLRFIIPFNIYINTSYTTTVLHKYTLFFGSSF
jgi:hypothetical protein